MKSYEILRKAFRMFANRENYAYFYGAKGIVLTDGAMNSLIKAEPEHFSRYSEGELERIKNYSRGKIGYDCSGFISEIATIFGSSSMQFNSTINRNSVEKGKAGTLLWKEGHIGIDIGYGYCMHIPIEGHTFEIEKIQKVGFVMSGEIPNVDYSDANNF